MPRIAVLAAAVCFGTTGTAQALGPSLEPAAVGAGRIVVGGALLVLVAALMASGRGGSGARWSAGLLRLPAPARGERGVVLVAGACVAVYQLTFFAAVADTGVAVGTVVAIGSAPAFAGLLGRAVNGEPLERAWAGATALACAGVVLLVLAGSESADVSPPGVALALLAGAGYAAYAVSSKRLLERGREPEWTMAAVFGTGAVLVLPVLAIVPSGGLLTLDGAALVVYLGAIPTALAYVLFARGLRRIGTGETATLTLAEPLTAAALGVAVLGERPGAAAIAGAALVLAGLGLLALRPAPVTAEAAA